MTKPKIAAVAMSGGVDSAVAALLLQSHLTDYRVLGLTMRLYREDEKTSEADQSTVSDARNVAQRIGIEHHVCDLDNLFRRCVIDEFCREYLAGRTPNPCITCNKAIKFGALWDYARSLEADVLATGHYARVKADASGRILIHRAVDETKDQSYMLWSLSQDVLRHVKLPLGEFTKAQVREIAADHGFINAQRRDSQDICFIPDGDYVTFVNRYTKTSPTEGDYLDISGNVIGRHKGMLHYTIGQRKGLGMSFGKHMFVCDKNAANNTVTLCDDEQLYRSTVHIKNCNFIAFDTLTTPLRVQAKLRYRHVADHALLIPTGENSASLVFDTPQRAPALGQSAVFYDGDVLLGGGIICGAE